MVSYLIVVGVLLAIVAVGITYGITSDMVDEFTPLYSSGQLSAYNDTDSDYYFDMLMFLFKYFLVPSLLILVFNAFMKAQKPEGSP